MGNLCWPKNTNQVVECIQQMQQVENTLARLIDKYEMQIAQQKLQARRKLNRKDDCIRHVKTIHIIRHHKQKLENRLTACLNKRYHLESLNVTKMHIDAVKTTSKTFQHFLKQNDIQKVEELQETLTEMIDDACEINETLTTDNSHFAVDDSEIEDEYNLLCSEIQLPEAPSTALPWPDFQMVSLDSDEDTEEESETTPVLKVMTGS
jgi:hypothetical protein